MADYIIGVDIGATKSHLALFDTEGTLLELGHWGPLNHEVMPGSFTQFEQEFGQFFSDVITKHGVSKSQIAYSVLGVGGVDTKKQHSIISQILKKLGMDKFTLVNDAYLGIPAGNSSGSGTGICAINGSGCTLAGINSKGNMLQIGGVGALSADMGGGGYMGDRVLSAVYSELFRKGEATLMTELLLKKAGITSKYDFVEIIQEKSADNSFSIRACNQMVFEAAAQGDKLAIGIILDMSANYSGGIQCMIEELQFSKQEDLYIIFAGSVFVKGEHPLLLDSLELTISKSNPGHNIKFIKLDMPNVAGAIVWALNHIHGKNSLYDKVCTQLRQAK